ncbi:hypothetical protein KFU94_70190 [Chloroflexi bacterium TSY]|nr:hypothetical protein [Chloroflexi bacterium TSY]
MSDPRSNVSSAGDGIAIIGMACRFPGARNIKEFWRNLSNGTESISCFSDDELERSGIDPMSLHDPNYVKAGAVLAEPIAEFDADFFNISAHEAEMMDPQHRILLECAWEALESSGYTSQQYEGARLGSMLVHESANTYYLTSHHPI